MKTILLTGASGFVGTNFILDLHKKFRIIALVRQNSDVKIIENKCKIIRYDNNLCEILDDIFANNDIDGVIHLATKWLSSHTPEDIKDIIDANILLGTYILEAVKRHKVAFFINATSFGAYCNSNRYRPATLYAASKRAFEDIIKYYALVAKGTTFCNLLIFNTFGLHDKTPRLFNLLDKVALNGDELDMSDGTQIVDYTHIKNVVFGFECLINLVLEKPSFCKNKIFTLQSPNRRSLRELVALYERLLGKKLNINWGKRAKRELEITQPFSGGVRLPNWREKVSLEAGFSELIARNVKNRKIGEVRAKSRNKNRTAKNSANNNHTVAPNAKNRKWGGAESRFLKESFALCNSDSIILYRLCEALQKAEAIHAPFAVFARRSNPRSFIVFARESVRTGEVCIGNATHPHLQIHLKINFYKNAESFKVSSDSKATMDCHDSTVAESRNDKIGMDCHANPYGLSRNDEQSNDSTPLLPSLRGSEAIYKNRRIYKEILFLNVDCLVPNGLCNDGICKIPRNFAESRKDDNMANRHAYKGDSSNEAIPRKKADSSHYIAESCKDKTTSDSTAIFTYKLHKSHTRKAVA